MADPVALAALALDAAIGWPARLYARVGHPVGGFARVLDVLEMRWNLPARDAHRRRLLGVLAVLLLVAATTALCLAAQQLASLLPGPLSWMVLALLAWPALAQRSLFQHVRAVASPLVGGDLPAARAAVSRIVGRDTRDLDQPGLARAAIESLAESFCDGVVAPLFWLLLLGLPGIWGYKAINTADSLVGHREERWRAFGWAAARTDDLVNLVPARLAGVILCLVAGGGWRVLWRDHARHASPNAGWPEAAMAGALGVALAGPVRYDGLVHDKPWIGVGGSEAKAADLARALTLYRLGCAILWLLAGGAAWLR